MDYTRRQLPVAEDQPEFRQAFARRRVEPDQRRTKLGIPEERAAADAAALAKALELYDRDYRRQPDYRPPTGITGLLPGARFDAELVHIESDEPGQPVVLGDEEDDFLVDDRTLTEDRPSGTPNPGDNDLAAER